MHTLNTQVAVASLEAQVSTVRELNLGIEVISESAMRLPFAAATRLPFASLGRLPFASMKLNAQTATVLLSV